MVLSHKSHDGLQNQLIFFLFLQARQKKKMMFGEQHLVRFGSMTKPKETDTLGEPQDAMDPQQVTHALLPTAQAYCLADNSDSSRTGSTLFLQLSQTDTRYSERKLSGPLWPNCVETLHACKPPLRPCMPLYVYIYIYMRA